MKIKSLGLCEICFDAVKSDTVCANCGFTKEMYSPESNDLLPGTVLANKYIVGGVIERKDCEITYLAFSAEHNKKVIIKEYFPKGIAKRDYDKKQITIFSADEQSIFEEFLNQFAKEAKIFVKLNSDRDSSDIGEVFFENNTVYYSEEFFEGTGFSEYIGMKGGYLSEDEAITIMRMLCEELKRVYSVQISSHGIITPEHIFVCKNGRLKFIDLSVINSSEIDKTTEWTDINYLGVLIYCALTGKPFKKSRFLKINFHKSLGISEEFKKIIKKCVPSKKEDVYQELSMLETDLEKLNVSSVTLGGDEYIEKVHFARVDHDEEKPLPKSSGNKKRIAIIMLGTVLSIVAGVFIYINVLYTAACNNLAYGKYSDAKRKLSDIKFYLDSRRLIQECDYQNAVSLLKDDNYIGALEAFEGVGNYKDTQKMMKECKYQQALSLLKNGDNEGAKKIFDTLSDYKDVASMSKECDYKTALGKMHSGDLLAAYDIFEALGNYSDSEKQLETIGTLAYNKGVELYHNESYNEAKKYFDKSSDKERTSDYLKLIKAHNGEISDASDLYSLIDFEDTKEILLSDKYICEFMLGNWEDSSGNYVYFFREEKDSIVTRANLPGSGKYYRVNDGIHYLGDDESGWKKQWSYTIITKNKIEVYCYNDGKTYILYRQ